MRYLRPTLYNEFIDVFYRDLKCENLLLDKNNKLLLTDFGFSKTITYDSNGKASLSSTFCGSAAYAAPEIIQGTLPQQHYFNVLSKMCKKDKSV